MSIPTPSIASTSRTEDSRNRAISKDILILGQFVRLYCQTRHAGCETLPVTVKGTLAPWINGLDLKLCSECRGLFLHGAAKRVLCPYAPKPRCKKCPTPCYRPGHREAMRAVMRDSGRRMILHGRLDLIHKYLF
jgi:hypothetical protein